MNRLRSYRSELLAAVLLVVGHVLSMPSPYMLLFRSHADGGATW